VDETRFSFSTELKVRFSETDAQGVAHHAAYLDWLEVARVEYLARFPGGYQGLRERGIEATTLEAYVRYRTPARFDDELVISARCGDVRGARFRFDYAIERDGEPVADGWTTHACVDARTLRPTRMPEFLKAELERAESSPAESSSSA
jgi:acyl-CoA thioester hydrolase